MPYVRRNTVDLFTADEHAVLANWLGVRPPKVAKGIEPDEAIARMGFETEPHHYRLVDAVVASIVLENVEKRLPAWSALRADGSFVCARKYRDDEKVPNRKVLLQSRRLFVINWADSGPGFSWPVAYHVTWLPHYDRFVVTASADCADGFWLLRLRAWCLRPRDSDQGGRALSCLRRLERSMARLGAATLGLSLHRRFDLPRRGRCLA
jgi:hypothetical protein